MSIAGDDLSRRHSEFVRSSFIWPTRRSQDIFLLARSICLACDGREIASHRSHSASGSQQLSKWLFVFFGEFRSTCRVGQMSEFSRNGDCKL
jgi:hypothetical protein